MKRIPSVALGRHLFVIAGLALASTVGNLSAADTYYVSDHLATTTAVADAAGEIASLEADAFGSPVSGGEQAARYTGKPYDADIGAYVFPFRNYRSAEARWMSADPSGFPDGFNSQVYTPEIFKNIDPLGLKKLLWLALAGDSGSDPEINALQALFNNQYNSMQAADTLPHTAYLDDGDSFDFMSTANYSFLSGSSIATYDVIYVVAHGVLTSNGYSGYNVNGATYSQAQIMAQNSRIALFDGCGSPAANGQITYAADVASRWFAPSRNYLYDRSE
jgi:RHS repeat-associated protein